MAPGGSGMGHPQRRNGWRSSLPELHLQPRWWGPHCCICRFYGDDNADNHEYGVRGAANSLASTCFGKSMRRPRCRARDPPFHGGGTKAGQHMMVNYASQNLSWSWFLARRGVEEDFFFFFFVFVSIVPRTTWWTRIARITFVLPLIPLHSSLPTASTLLPRGFGCFSDQTSPCSWRPFVKGLCDSQNLCVLGWERSTKFWLEWAGVTSEGQHNTESGIVQPTFPSWIEVRPEFKELVTLAVQRLKAVEASLDCWVRCRVFTESTTGWCHAGHEGTYICCHFAQHVYTWF